MNEPQLPQSKTTYSLYQLIRNVLAASALDCSFCVMLDARRPDLLEQWYVVMRCVKIGDLRTRCKVLTWQEVSEALPPELQEFLDEKYGIRPGRLRRMNSSTSARHSKRMRYRSTAAAALVACRLSAAAPAMPASARYLAMMIGISLARWFTDHCGTWLRR